MPQPANPIHELQPVSAANLFASRGVQDDTIVIGGLMPDETQWTQTLTHRAARALWVEMTKLLFPDKSAQVIGHVATLPSLPPFQDDDESNLTTWAFVRILDEGGCEISGWKGKTGWCLHLNAYQVYRFWAALDVALFPAGWSVRS